MTKNNTLINKLRRVLSNDEKLEFVKTSVSWIQGKDIMDTCFILNFGFEAPLPWPQVYVGMILIILIILTYQQVRMRLDDDEGKGLQLVPGSYGMSVPSACTIVFISG